MKRFILLCFLLLILNACSVAHNRTEMAPIPEHGWEVKYSPVKITEGSILEFSGKNNFVSQASYKCDNYKLYVNSIPVSSYSLFGTYLPIIPLYFKSNEKMSVFIRPDKKETILVNNINDCPELSIDKQSFEVVGGRENLCHYQVKHELLDQSEFKLTINDKKNNCTINDLQLIRKSNSAYSLLCLENESVNVIRKYQDLETLRKKIDDGTSEQDVIYQPQSSGIKTTFAVTAGLVSGFVVGAASTYLLFCSNDDGRGCSSGDGYIAGIVAGIGGYYGIYLGLKYIAGNKDPMLNVEYRF